MNDLLAKYQEHLLAKNVSKNTYESYIRDITYFIKYLEANGGSSPESITFDRLERFVAYHKANGKSPATITRSIASVRKFIDFMIELGVISENPAKLLKLDKVEKKIPEILTNQEITKLLSQPNVKEAKGCRDKAMLELLYATGIRVSELVALNLSDINLSKGLLHCQISKYDRWVPMYPAAVSAVSDYIQRVRGHLLNNLENPALFINLNGLRLTRQGFWKIVKNYALAAKIPKEITPHTLRHSFALHLLENGATVKDIQEMMGHADISSTLFYVHLMDNHIKDVYNNCHPRAKM